jgi:hypothetical protein
VSIDFTGTFKSNSDFIDILRQWDCLDQCFSNCGPRTTTGPPVLLLWSS